MKYKLVAFWLIVFGALFAFLQMCFEYHFYYIEQSQLFLFSEAYIRNKLLLPGGFSMLVAEFLVQFFIRPYVGALVTAVLLTGVGVCTAGIVKRIAPVSGLFILYVLPMLALLFMHFDFNYRVQGTVCYLMMMALLCGYMRIGMIFSVWWQVVCWFRSCFGWQDRLPSCLPEWFACSKGCVRRLNGISR